MEKNSEWTREEIMAELEERQMIEATLADLAEEQEREQEEEIRRHAGGHTRVNDIDYEPKDYSENTNSDYGYAVAGMCWSSSARYDDF